MPAFKEGGLPLGLHPVTLRVVLDRFGPGSVRRRAVAIADRAAVSDFLAEIDHRSLGVREDFTESHFQRENSSHTADVAAGKHRLGWARTR